MSKAQRRLDYLAGRIFSSLKLLTLNLKEVRRTYFKKRKELWTHKVLNRRKLKSFKVQVFWSLNLSNLQFLHLQQASFRSFGVPQVSESKIIKSSNLLQNQSFRDSNTWNPQQIENLHLPKSKSSKVWSLVHSIPQEPSKHWALDVVRSNLQEVKS